jgi:lipid A 4'-phosphatase
MSVVAREPRTESARVLPFVSNTGMLDARTSGVRSGQLFVLVVLPLIGLVVGTMLLTLTEADLAVSRSFYDEPSGSWPWGQTQPWQLLYKVGCLPGLLLGVLGFIVAVTCLIRGRRERYYRPGLFLVCMLLIGPGLLVNLCMKDHWGRPRPRDTVHFGGQRDYHPVWSPTFNLQGHSFPSGHASMGFYLMAPGFLLWRTRRRAAILFFAFGLFAGALMGAARIIQGSHFATDILWSAGFVYFAGLLLTPMLEARNRTDDLADLPSTVPGSFGDAKPEATELPKAA